MNLDSEGQEIRTTTCCPFMRQWSRHIEPSPQLTRAIFPASSSSVSLRRAFMLLTISRTKLQVNP